MCVSRFVLAPRHPSDLLGSFLGAFQLYDIDKDGLITYDEMLRIVESIYAMTGEMVKLPADEDTPQKVPDRSRWSDRPLTDPCSQKTS